MSRRNVYYWKCDRPAALHGTALREEPSSELSELLLGALRTHFSTDAVQLHPGASQGNHLTWSALVGDTPMFVRVENGPEKDPHLLVESEVIRRVGELGVPVPHVFAVDVSRDVVPFAWQANSLLPWPDLNVAFKEGVLEVDPVARSIGAAVATWQALSFERFGVFDADVLRQAGALSAFHPTYADYFQLRLREHLQFLVGRGFLTEVRRRDIEKAIVSHAELLELEQGCLVHKDLALWNVLGTSSEVGAFIDFDDAISGDPMDDLSLLACFHDAPFLEAVFAGYQSVRPLPQNHLRRFWLHLLRNLIVKAVIRVGAGYFERDSRFFLVGSNGGAALRQFTEDRLALALHGLRTNAALSIL